ncbi:MAG: zinc-dependent alcohol dehydrogenase [Pseudonocardiaceae bacterium]
MRLLTLPEPGVLAWDEVPTPAPGPTEVAVAVTHVGICGSDVEVFRGHRPAHVRHGRPVLGHEVCGVIEEVGGLVRGPGIGDVVTCIEGWGAFADRVITTPTNLLRLPRRIAPADGCLAEVLPGVAMAAWRTGITRSHHVLIVGQGLSGLLLTRLVHLHGCARLTVVDPHQCRLDLAREFGADVTVLDTVDGLAGSGFASGDYDVAILATPVNVVDAVVPLMRPRSRIVMYGGLESNATVDVMALHRRSISLVKESESVNGTVEARQLWAAATELAADGVLPLHRLRTHTLGFDEVTKAFSIRMEDPSALHVVCVHPEAGS